MIFHRNANCRLAITCCFHQCYNAQFCGMKGKAYRKSNTIPNVSFHKVHFNCAACNTAFAFHIIRLLRCWLDKTENTFSLWYNIREVLHSNCSLHWVPFSSLSNFVASFSGLRAGTLGNWNDVQEAGWTFLSSKTSNTFDPTRDHWRHCFGECGIKQAWKEIGRFSISINDDSKFA